MNFGIIGGADGPTSIIVTSLSSWGYIVGAAVIAGGIFAFIIYRKNR